MRSTAIIFVVVSIIFIAASRAADDYTPDGEADMVDLRPGLESEEVSPGVRVVVPEGAEKRMVNPNLSVLESAEEYAARKFVDANKRIDELERSYNELKRELYFVKKALNEIDKKMESKKR